MKENVYYILIQNDVGTIWLNRLYERNGIAGLYDNMTYHIYFKLMIFRKFKWFTVIFFMIDRALYR